MCGRRVVICAYYGCQDQNPSLSTDKWATRLGSCFSGLSRKARTCALTRSLSGLVSSALAGPGATYGSAIIGITRRGVSSRLVY
ncbi:uncharacterized protein PpBr36_05789 [Pyricularia pennisetigena]|uniref:uncharacterized protein n=1 Tax=Pyricularia pennisetigena TaxID=1578925 RepID=UPI0011527113|nr:uncharacterized protein PpBr36_05789 [Pyricularia pennisetigena]TLS23448.1 hypothetical protein PpBr36_05789 [Pyricularia pennisetigena]